MTGKKGRGRGKGQRSQALEFDFEDIMNTITEADVTEIQNIMSILGDQGHVVTKALLKKITAAMSINRCLCCPEAFGSKRELKNHMEEANHYYGQNRLGDDKRRFLYRVYTEKPHLITASFKTKGGRLSDKESRVYTSLYNRIHELSRPLRSTLERLIEFDICLITLDSVDVDDCTDLISVLRVA